MCFSMVEPFAAVDVIKAKRDGRALTPAQIVKACKIGECSPK